MHKYSIKPSLQKILQKLSKKDKSAYEQILTKIEEVLVSQNINHYKNLRSPLQRFKRVHIKGSFVLMFKYNPIIDEVEFFDFDHHDNIYKKNPGE